MWIRIFDLIIGSIGTLVLAVMYPFIALLIKLDSKGPVIYKCDRVGLNGKVFKMYKFRTMYDRPDFRGASISPMGDPRVTDVGRMLRRSKLNEFPQFINVLKGDLTVVGPRAESPDLAALYPAEARQIFTVKPGLFGVSQLFFRNEDELIPPGADPQEYYFSHILPRKLELELEYIRTRSLWKNIKCLLQMVWVIISGTVSRRHLEENRSQILLLVTDAVLCLASFALAHWLRFERLADPASEQAFWQLLPWVVLIRLPIFIYLGFYYVLIRHLSLYDLKKVFQGVALASFALVAFGYLSGMTRSYSRAVFLIDWFGLTVFLTGYRALAKKLYLHFKANGSEDVPHERILIWGAGDCGELCLRYLQKEQSQNYEVVGFIDDDRKKQGKRLGGYKILGDRHHLEAISHIHKVKQVIIAVANAPWSEIQKMMDFCSILGLIPRLFSIQVGQPQLNPGVCSVSLPTSGIWSQVLREEVGSSH